MPHKTEEARREYARLYYYKYRDKLMVNARQYRLALRKEILAHYGNGVLACVRCGFDDLRALTIDHMNNEPFAQREYKGGYNLYASLKRQGFPMGLQTLCWNCQWIKKAEKGENGIHGKYL